MRPLIVQCAGALLLALSLAAPAAAVDSKSDAALDLTGVRSLIKSKQYAPARDELLKIVTTHPVADVYNLLGFTFRKTGDHANALTYYRIALDHDPDHKGAHEYIGELFIETKQPELARRHHAALVRLCPTGCEEREDLETAMREAGIGF